jgi:hypothetical protein
MFDNLYDNIGGKIKGWAKWIFIVEAIGAVIAGIALMVDAGDIDTLQFVMGIVTVVFGPLVAYVSSWLLYAFGQLVEDIHIIRIKQTIASEDGLIENTENVQNSDWIAEQQKQGIRIGKCEICGSKKQELVTVEFEDFFGKATKSMCYDCFCKRH